MSEYEIRSVGGHVEVYTRGGVFLFSADTVREAMEEPLKRLNCWMMVLTGLLWRRELIRIGLH